MTAKKSTARDGKVFAWIYDQEGKQQPFIMRDTPNNRMFAQWLDHHDRYTVGERV